MKSLNELKSRTEELHSYGESIIRLADELNEKIVSLTQEKPPTENAKEPPVKSPVEKTKESLPKLPVESAKELPEKLSAENAKEPPVKSLAASPSPEAPKSPTLCEVRHCLSILSQAGFTREATSLITQRGVRKVSDLDPSVYGDLLAEADRILGDRSQDRISL